MPVRAMKLIARSLRLAETLNPHVFCCVVNVVVKWWRMA